MAAVRIVDYITIDCTVGPDDVVITDGGPDRWDDLLRSWWVIGMLCEWHSTGTSTPDTMYYGVWSWHRNGEPDFPAADRSRFPGTCPRCGAAAYVGASVVDCSSRRCA